MINILFETDFETFRTRIITETDTGHIFLHRTVKRIPVAEETEGGFEEVIRDQITFELYAMTHGAMVKTTVVKIGANEASMFETSFLSGFKILPITGIIGDKLKLNVERE